MNELVIRADGVELATQSFGDPAQPPILLIMGGMASMLWWPAGILPPTRRTGPLRHPLRPARLRSFDQISARSAGLWL